MSGPVVYVMPDGSGVEISESSVSRHSVIFRRAEVLDIYHKLGDYLIASAPDANPAANKESSK